MCTIWKRTVNICSVWPRGTSTAGANPPWPPGLWGSAGRLRLRPSLAHSRRKSEQCLVATSVSMLRYLAVIISQKMCAIEKLSFAMKYILNLNQIDVKLNIKLVIIDSFLYRKNAYLSETVPYSRQILHMLKCTHSSLQVTGEPMPDVRWYKDGACIDINRYPRFSSFSSEGSVSVVLAWRRVCPSYVDLIIISKGSFDFVILRKEYEI